MNTTTEKKPYEAPQLTVVSFKVERGYATSIVTLGLIIDGQNEDEYVDRNDYGNANTESWF